MKVWVIGSWLYSVYKTLIYCSNKWHSFVPIILKSLKDYTPDMMFLPIPLALHDTIYHIARVSTWALIEFLEWKVGRSSKGSTYLNKLLFHISNSSLKKPVHVYFSVRWAYLACVGFPVSVPQAVHLLERKLQVAQCSEPVKSRVPSIWFVWKIKIC